MIPIKTAAKKKINSFLHNLAFLENPIFSHLISSGSGALSILTPYIGNQELSFFGLQHLLKILYRSLLAFSIMFLAFEYLRVTKMMFLSSSSG